MAVAVSKYALTTLSNVKDELGIDQSDTTQDNRLMRLINSSSSLIEDSVCSRKFGKRRAIERLVGSDTLILNLSLFPIRSVSDISIDGVSIPEAQVTDPYLADGDQYTVYRSQGQVYRRAGWRWSAKAQNDLTWDPNPYAREYNVSVTYEGGYITPQMAVLDSSQVPDLPSALEEATIRAIVYYLNTAPATQIEITPGTYRRELYDEGLMHDLNILLAGYIKHDRADIAVDYI